MVHPAFGVNTNVRVETLPEENQLSTARTVRRMFDLAIVDATDPIVTGIARALRCSSVRHYVESVHDWVRRHVRFVQDVDLAAPLGIGPVAEVLIRPRELVRMPQPMGDCDDYSMLTMALLQAGGIPASFATVAANSAQPSDYSHVYVIAHTPEGDIPVDASHGGYAGWAAPNLFNRLREWSVGMAGLGCGCDVGYVEGLGFVASTSAPAAPPWWQQLITSGITSGTQIAQTVLQRPTYYSGPDGTTIYASGQSPTVAPPGSSVGSQILPGVDNSTVLLGGIAVLVAVAMLSRRGR
jgi:predicted transglutaminase-like cysteine proteinase